MRRILRFAAVPLATIALTMAAPTTSSAACLTSPSDVVGNPALGATVQTFINLGIDPNTTCIDGALWTDPASFTLGSFLGGAEGQGFGYNPTVLGAYNGATTGVGNANALDFYWVQDTSANASPGGVAGSAPSQGLIFNLGGQANQVAVFVFVDHGPLPGEVLENTAWLSNNPNSADAGWTQASLVHVYGGGFSPDPNIADGFVAVYQLPNAATFQYVSITWGGPGAVLRDGDNEIDAVGGLSFEGTGIGGTVPEPDTLALLSLALGGMVMMRRRRA